jgi:beta-N-acetylhexosaminidase
MAYRKFLPASLLVACVAYAATPTKTKPGSGANTTAAAPVNGLSLQDRIAQLIVVRAYGDYLGSRSAEYRTLVHWVRDLHVGGFIVANRVRNGSVINAQPYEMASFINHMQKMARTPLFVASDFEHGASMRVAETAKFPYFMAYGAARDLNAVRELGAATAHEARTIGVTWVFAPDADVNNNPDNPIINTRSFGEDAQAVADGVDAFIAGAHSDPESVVLVTAKHFPGHGDTDQDSHMQLPKVDQTKERIESMELVPFRSAIAHGVDAVMTAHMAVPAFEPEAKPATVSRNILTGLLREELGFKGIIVTDALDMQGVTALYRQGDLAVRAIEAGADVLLMPSDPQACIQALVAAVQSGRISRKRIDESVARILTAKKRVGLFKTRLVDLDQIPDNLDLPRFDDLAQATADKSVTLVKDEKHLFPIPNADDACVVVLSEGQFSRRGETLINEVHSRAPKMKAFVANSAMTDAEFIALAGDLGGCQQIYVAAFVTVAAYRGSVGLEGGLPAFMTKLVHGSSPVALISLGSPYLLRDYPDVQAYAATFSTSSTSEIAATKAIFGEIPISGKLPVSIPGFAKVGDGLSVPVKAKQANNTVEHTL